MPSQTDLANAVENLHATIKSNRTLTRIVLGILVVDFIFGAYIRSLF